MAAKSGKDVLLKLDSDGNNNFISVAGLRSSNIAFNSTTVDITNASSTGQWRELLEGAGVKSASISGSGVFRDSTTDATIRQLFFANSVRSWQVVIPDFGTINGLFQLTALEYSGNYDGAATYEIALVSAGELQFSSS
jgi:TP901-1 family phage major tail protein